ncbi:pseudouridine synthase [Thioalkalivibrio sulfidiphilus]|uniref:pseudouridine synthase n=1 Tax=Thioalkalivibrio sulfidiphilus TaxID=1033854 RepID=UPI003B2B760D
MHAAAPLTILHQDDDLVAINKPEQMLVHRSPISRDEVFVLQRLRDQLGQRVYTVHRLDRPTSGVLLFGLHPAAATAMARQFEAGEVHKRYLAVVRGYTEESGEIDHPLESEDGRGLQEAVTRYRRLATVELDIPVGRYPVARYSLLEVWPRSGRRHQIRRHFKHIFHPLAGDTTYGEGRHNRLFREHFGVERLLLHANHLSLRHPTTDEALNLHAPLPETFRVLLQRLGWTAFAH